MSDVSVLCKSYVVHLAEWTTLCAEFKCFDEIPPFAVTNWDKDETCGYSICLIETFLLMKLK